MIARLRRWVFRLALGLALLFAFSLAIGRFVPLVSNLMLARWAIGKPVERIWVPANAISPLLARAVIASEDQRFCAHWGVDFIALREVLDDEDGPSRGASTITMQLAKNLYLWPGRSYVRKALEIPLALVLDVAWGKKRVLEAYLNIAEWGDGIFGAEAAARHYFNKSARDLTAVEAARLAAALPNPILRAPTRASASSRRIAQAMAGVSPYATCLEQ